MGGWEGGQAEYVMVPFADFNLLKFPDRDQALEKILDLTMLSDIFPTGYHGAVTAGVTTGSTVYVAGAGPVGLAAAYSSLLLGAAVVIVGDRNADRLAQARSFGCETVDISQDASLEDQIAEILGVPEVDCAVDAVGFEASGHGKGAGEAPATVLNSIMALTRAGGRLGIPGLYVTGDPGAPDEDAKEGTLKVRLGLGWAKSHSFTTGQCPVLKYNRELMMSHPARQGAHRGRGERHGDPAGRRPTRLPGVRPGRSAQVRAGPARDDPAGVLRPRSEAVITPVTAWSGPRRSGRAGTAAHPPRPPDAFGRTRASERLGRQREHRGRSSGGHAGPRGPGPPRGQRLDGAEGLLVDPLRHQAEAARHRTASAVLPRPATRSRRRCAGRRSRRRTCTC